METLSIPTPFVKFKEKIESLSQKSSRFKRVFSEYCTMSEELSILENSEMMNLPEDFFNALKLQIAYLKEEIEDWLHFSE